MTKLSKAQLTLELEFLDGTQEDGFNVYDALHSWARQVANGSERDQTIFLGDYQLVDTTPFVELPRLKLYIPQQSEPYISTKEDEEQYRCSNPKKVSRSGFAHWLFKRFDISFEITNSPD
jgi:hypothetical protein|tara:strand:+ start:262 stop:621 length:360 start_codon:yes stop_codon:yes gene_type:complete